jgi:hypothetical protein
MPGRCSLVFGCLMASGCSLVLDFDDPPSPPDAVPIDAIVGSACDFGEDNQTRQTAHPLGPVSGQLAGICEPGDHDFYSIDVAEGQVLVFEVRFGQLGAQGDLDIRVYDVNGEIVGSSASSDDDERIECPAAQPPCGLLPAGPYFLEVFGFGDAAINGYSMELTLTP